MTFLLRRANQALRLSVANWPPPKKKFKFYEYFYLLQLNKGAKEHALHTFRCYTFAILKGNPSKLTYFAFINIFYSLLFLLILPFNFLLPSNICAVYIHILTVLKCACVCVSVYGIGYTIFYNKCKDLLC